MKTIHITELTQAAQDKIYSCDAGLFFVKRSGRGWRVWYVNPTEWSLFLAQHAAEIESGAIMAVAFD